MPDIGKTSKMFDPVMLSEFGTVLCSDEEVYDHAMESLLNNDDCDQLSLPTVVMLGTFYKRGSVEIKDPVRSTDQSAFDKCYWLVYYSVQGFLKSIKEEKEKTAVKLVEVEDVINKNSSGFKKKPRKKSIIPDLCFISPFPSSDYLPPPPLQFALSQPLPVHDLPDRVNFTPSEKIQQTNVGVEQEIYCQPPVRVVETTRPSLLLSPPAQVHDDTEDCVNRLQGPPSHPPLDSGHQIDPPILHWLQPPPPVFCRSDLRPLVPRTPPHIDQEDHPNKPQPVSNRRYHLEDTSSDRLAHFSLYSLEKDPGDCSVSSPEFLSRLSSPHLPRSASLRAPQHLRQQEISPEVPYHPPADTWDHPPHTELITLLSPPQAVIYSPAEDHVNFPSSKVKSYAPQVKLTKPLVIRALRSVSPTSGLPSISSSPPQAPEFLRENVNREDLFDQVRRHSRGIFFFK